MRQRIEREEAAPARHQAALDSYESFDFTEALSNLKQALQFDPDNLKFKEMMGLVSLGNHDFEEAASYFKLSNDLDVQELIAPCTALKNYSNSIEKIPLATITELISTLHNAGNNEAIYQLLVKETRKNYSISAKIELAYKAIQLQNPEIKRIIMDCTVTKSGKVKVALKNQPVHTIGALIILPIEELKINYTNVDSLDQLLRSQMSALKAQLPNLRIIHDD